MNTDGQEPWLDAALRCYALADSRKPGSPGAEAAELAVVYAMSDHREAASADDLLKAALHDGQRTILRARRGRARIEQELAHLSAAGIDTAGARAVAGDGRPEHVVFARELLAELDRCATELGNPAPRVLAGLLAGETEAETARAAHTSRSTVTRTRRALRKHATSVGYLPAAA